MCSAQKCIEICEALGGRPGEEGVVYFLKADNGLYKIGKAKILDRRVKQIKPALPYETEVVLVASTDSMDFLEQFFHRYFADKRLRGEWFDLTEKDLDFALEHAAEPFEDYQEYQEKMRVEVLNGC